MSVLVIRWHIQSVCGDLCLMGLSLQLCLCYLSKAESLFEAFGSQIEKDGARSKSLDKCFYFPTSDCRCCPGCWYQKLEGWCWYCCSLLYAEVICVICTELCVKDRQKVWEGYNVAVRAQKCLSQSCYTCDEWRVDRWAFAMTWPAAADRGTVRFIKHNLLFQQGDINSGKKST